MTQRTEPAQRGPTVFDICPNCDDGMLFAVIVRTSDATCDLCDHVVPLGTPTPNEPFPSLETPSNEATEARLQPQASTNDETIDEVVEKSV